MRRGLAIVAIALLALGLFGIAGIAPARRRIEREVADVLRRALPERLELDRVSLEIAPPRLTVLRPRLREGGRPVLEARELTVTLAAGASLWEGAWFLDVDVDGPVVEIDPAKPWWTELSPRGASGETSVSVRRVTIRNGEANVRLPEDVSLHLADVAVSVRWRGWVAPVISVDARAIGSAKRGERQVAIDNMALRAEVRGRTVTIESASLAAAGTELRASGTIDGSEIAGSFETSVVVDPILALIPEAGDVGGVGRISARVSGSIAEPIVDASVDVEKLRIGKIELAGRSPLRVRGLDWELGPAAVEIFGGKADGTAKGTLAPDLPYRLEASVRSWDPALFLGVLDLDLPIAGQLSGESTLRGRLFAEEVEGTARFDVRMEERRADGDVTFRVSPQRDAVELAIRPLGGGEVRARDEITGDRHDGRVTARALDLAKVAPFLGVSLAGVTDAEAKIANDGDAPALDGTGTILDLVVNGLRIGHVEGPFLLSPSRLRTSGIVTAELGAQAHGEWRFAGESLGDGAVELTDASLERWASIGRQVWPELPDVRGTVTGRATWAGPRAAPRARIDAAATDVVIGDEALGRVEVGASRADSGLTVDARFRGRDEDRAELRFVVDPRNALRGKVRIERWMLAHVAAVSRLGESIDGVLTGEATIDGSTDRPRVTGAVRVADVGIAGWSVDSFEGKIRYDGRAAAFDVTAGDRLSVRAEASGVWPHAFEAKGEWKDLAFSLERARERRFSLSSSGSFEVRGDATRALERGTARVERIAFWHPAGALWNAAPWEVKIADGAAALDRGALIGTDQRIEISAKVSAESYRVRAVGEASLAIAEGWVPGLVSSRGRLDLAVDASGRGGAPPRLQGNVRITDGAADLGVLVGLTNVTGALEFGDEDVAIRDFAGTLGTGRFSVDGSISPDRGLDLRWKLRRASFGVPEWLDHRLSGQGTVSGPIGEPLVAGDVRVEQAIYDQNVEWGEFLPWFRRQTRMPAARRVPVRLDLHVVADDGLFVDNNLAKIELTTNVHVSGDVTRPTIAGRMEVLEGRITFRERVFELTSGELRFDEARPLDPSLDIRGESRIRTPDDEIEIDLHVSGTAESPRIEFASDDPSLGQNDLIALATFGRTAAQLQTGGAGLSLDEVLSLAGGGRAKGLESDVRRVLPVDRIEIESAFSRTTGTTEPRVRIEKDLTSSIRATPLGRTLRGPMRASVGSSLGTGQERDVTLEYDLTRSISLEGLWESQTESGAGAFGADVKFRVPFWELRFSLLPDWLCSRDADPGAP